MRIIVFLFIMVLPVMAIAQDVKFDTSSEDIVGKLSSPGKIKYRSFGTPPGTRGVKVVKYSNGKIVEKTTQVPQKPDTKTVRIRVQFDHDSATIREESLNILHELALALNNEKLTKQKVMISGHTDSDGSDKYNLELSLRRAKAIRTLLVEKYSIAAQRVDVQGFGENMPLCSNNTAAEKHMNRRVEIEAID